MQIDMILEDHKINMFGKKIVKGDCCRFIRIDGKGTYLIYHHTLDKLIRKVPNSIVKISG